MFKKTYIIVLETEEEVYRLMKVAFKHSLYATYKIGVYGTERQHELYIRGNILSYYKFMHEVNRAKDEG
ncbi:MAG: hypothetical protein IKZ08_02635 [Bacteroidales bacterium]|nr:hypothetical protein [Bacteroidales bacterium]